MVYWIIKKIFGPFIRLIWVKKIEGLENIPETGSCIIASNHSSYFDFICFISLCPRRVYYLAAEKFFKGKIWGILVKATGQIKVERHSEDKSESFDAAVSILKQGEVLGIFPEGTRSPDGEIHKIYTGVAKFALMAKVPVIPVGIKGTYEILPRQKKFPKFKKIAEFKIGKPMLFLDYYGEEDNKEILREITDKIMLKIAGLSGKKCYRSEN